MKLYRVTRWGDLDVVEGERERNGYIRLGKIKVPEMNGQETYYATFAEAKARLVSQIAVKLEWAEKEVSQMRQHLAVAQAMAEGKA